MSETMENPNWVRLARLGHVDILFPNLEKVFDYLKKISPGYSLGTISDGKRGRAAMDDNGPYMDVITWSIPIYFSGKTKDRDSDGKIIIYRCI